MLKILNGTFNANKDPLFLRVLDVGENKMISKIVVAVICC